MEETEVEEVRWLIVVVQSARTRRRRKGADIYQLPPAIA